MAVDITKLEKYLPAFAKERLTTRFLRFLQLLDLATEPTIIIGQQCLLAGHAPRTGSGQEVNILRDGNNHYQALFIAPPMSNPEVQYDTLWNANQSPSR